MPWLMNEMNRYHFQYDPKHGRFETPLKDQSDCNDKGCSCCIRLDSIRNREYAKLGPKTDHGPFHFNSMLITNQFKLVIGLNRSLLSLLYLIY